MVVDNSGNTDLAIIDSHIHLYAASHIPSLNWAGDLPTDHPLNKQNSVDEYKVACSKQLNLRGFIFLETDRKSGLDEADWDDALDEVDYLQRIAQGKPIAGEGHQAEDSKLLLGLVPWAPVPAGPTSLATYVRRVQSRFAETGADCSLVKGFRYLVQDKPSQVMLQPKFLESLKWLGENDLTFDLGVDARSGGLYQLREACDMMNILYDHGCALKMVINHFCKPNLRLSAFQAQEGHPDFVQWSDYIKQMASHNTTYMKLSGMFSELPPQVDGPADISTLVAHTKPWVDVVFKEFGPTRVMFGSDWPVCNAGGPGIINSWQHWHDLVSAILDAQMLTQSEKAEVWSGTASRAYNVHVKPVTFR